MAAAMWSAQAGLRLGTGRHVSQFKAATCRRTPHGGRVRVVRAERGSVNRSWVVRPADGISGTRARFGG